MRYTVGQVATHPTRWGAWWEDLPTRHRWWWRELLLDQASGWLRWKGAYVPDWDTIDGYRYDAGGVMVYPPLRRVWQYVKGHVLAPYYMVREHLSWEEVTFSWSDLPTDPDRKRLWS